MQTQERQGPSAQRVLKRLDVGPAGPGPRFDESRSSRDPQSRVHRRIPSSAVGPWLIWGFSFTVQVEELGFPVSASEYCCRDTSKLLLPIVLEIQAVLLVVEVATLNMYTGHSLQCKTRLPSKAARPGTLNLLQPWKTESFARIQDNLLHRAAGFQPKTLNRKLQTRRGERPPAPKARVTPLTKNFVYL